MLVNLTLELGLFSENQIKESTRLLEIMNMIKYFIQRIT
jgi:hypothetical protein